MKRLLLIALVSLAACSPSRTPADWTCIRNFEANARSTEWLVEQGAITGEQAVVLLHLQRSGMRACLLAEAANE